MDFAQPLALALALLAVPLAVLSLRSRSGSIPIAHSAGLLGTRPTARLRASRALPLLATVTIVLFAVALAGPRKGKADVMVPGEGVDIVLSLDISGSMSAPFGRGHARTVRARALSAMATQRRI